MVLKLGTNSRGGSKKFQPFAANVLVMERPGTRFPLVKCVNYLWKSDISNKDADN